MKNINYVTLLSLFALNITYAEYTAKIHLEKDSTGIVGGALPHGSIVFLGENGEGNGNTGNNNGNEDGGSGSTPSEDEIFGEDPEEIICSYSNGRTGYRGYSYHYIEAGVTTWFQDSYIGSPNSIYTVGALKEMIDDKAYYEVCAPSKYYDGYRLKEAESSGKTNGLVSIDGYNFQKTITGDFVMKPFINDFNYYIANSKNSENNLMFNDASVQWLSGGYSNGCVSINYPYEIKPGQVRYMNQGINFQSCGITSYNPGVVRVTFLTDSGESLVIQLNVSKQ